MSGLRETLRGEGGLLAGAVGEQDAPDALAERAAAGREGYALTVEAIREGHRLHTGRPATVTRADPDLGLLAGDRLYALGLARLARAGDLEAIAELADVISLCALSQASGDDRLASLAWEAGADALAHGRGPEHPGAAAATRRQRGTTTKPGGPPG